jgi:hypothetical protein
MYKNNITRLITITDKELELKIQKDELTQQNKLIEEERQRLGRPVSNNTGDLSDALPRLPND